MTISVLSVTCGDSSPKGRAKVCAPLYRRIPRRDRAVRPYAPSTERPPCFFSVIPRAQRARGNPFPAPAGAESPPPSVREVAHRARGNPFSFLFRPAAKGRHLPLPLCGKGAI